MEAVRKNWVVSFAPVVLRHYLGRGRNSGCAIRHHRRICLFVGERSLRQFGAYLVKNMVDSGKAEFQ